MLTNNALVGAVAAAVLILGLAGCAWFRPRKPETALPTGSTSAATPPSPGSHLVVVAPGPARGLVTVAETQDGSVRLIHAGQGLSLHVPLGELSAMTRAPMTRGAAVRSLERLQRKAAADNRPRNLRFITDIKVLSRGTTEEQLDRLAQLYAWPWKPGFGDLKMIDSYEQTALSELAFVLGEPLPELVKRAREHKPVFDATQEAPQDPPWEYASNGAKTPRMPGLSALGTLSLGEAAVIGERVDQHGEPDNGLARIALMPGTWHVYTASGLLPVASEDSEDPSEPEEGTLALVLLREGRASVGRQELKAVAELKPQFGRRNLAVIDAASVGDELLSDSVRYLGGTNVYGGRAACLSVEELPEHVPVFAAPEHLPTAIVIPLTSPEVGLSFLK